MVILDEPTRGVDIGARRRIHEFIVELAGRGAGVLLISSEMEEVLGLAHRAYLVGGGRIVDEIDAGEVGPERGAVEAVPGRGGARSGGLDERQACRPSGPRNRGYARELRLLRKYAVALIIVVLMMTLT